MRSYRLQYLVDYVTSSTRKYMADVCLYIQIAVYPNCYKWLAATQEYRNIIHFGGDCWSHRRLTIMRREHHGSYGWMRCDAC